jgi:hypothetical protein
VGEVCGLSICIRKRVNCIVRNVVPLKTLSVIVRGDGYGVHVVLGQRSMLSVVHYPEHEAATVRMVVVYQGGVDDTHEASHSENNMIAHVDRL